MQGATVSELRSTFRVNKLGIAQALVMPGASPSAVESRFCGADWGIMFRVTPICDYGGLLDVILLSLTPSHGTTAGMAGGLFAYHRFWMVV